MKNTESSADGILVARVLEVACGDHTYTGEEIKVLSQLLEVMYSLRHRRFIFTEIKRDFREGMTSVFRERESLNRWGRGKYGKKVKCVHVFVPDDVLET